MLSTDMELLLLLLDHLKMTLGREAMPTQLWEATMAPGTLSTTFTSVPYIVESTKDKWIATHQLVQGAHANSTIPGLHTRWHLEAQQNAAQILQA
ncbi:hypothetical protein H4R34_004806 [Dimargaris verticillata]|uniref:Uncharacterized protein n=1 Tax=Dimargaris verticillata TaxID=2761393 RepID=A0A9W8AY42_9FUNG|nr:hypothetical protein H4R34_004806 [Dimargaris verticillata]